MPITASKLYDYLTCEHRVWRDVHGPQDEKDQEPNPFVALLWERGVAYEQERLALAGAVIDAREGTLDERAKTTIAAMCASAPLIYQGVLQVDDLLGIPDFLRRELDGSYVPIDIKSGMGVAGVEGDDENGGSLKATYAVQLALYVDALRRLGFETACRGIILDIRGREVVYDLERPQGVRTPETYWDLYRRAKREVAALINGTKQNEPAMAGACKLCPWYGSCKKWVEAQDDPTGLFYVGRKVRDVLRADGGVRTIAELCTLDTEELLERKGKDKGFLKGIGKSTLEKAVLRANIKHAGRGPVLYQAVEFPGVSHELFFDIEDDPTQEFVYMHGVYERSPQGERYLDFTAEEVSVDAERDAWRRFWAYIASLPADDYAVYYYSAHERTTYRKMWERYPDVIDEERLNAFFDPALAIDLYTEVILKHTDWPLGSYSVKAIAQYLGFRWRDATPSGALSIQWFNEYVQSRKPALLERIRLYNEDDCKATLVVKDAVARMHPGRG